MKLKPLDYFIASIALLTTLFFFAQGWFNDENSVQVIVDDPQGTSIYPLDQATLLEVQGTLGSTIVEIKDEKVRVLESPCSQKICVAASYIKRPGDWIACLPNGVFIRLEGEAEGEIDVHSH